MALTDSKSGKILRHYSSQELKDSANLMRAYDLVALHAAGSGHAGGTLSIMDLTAALYLEIANHDPLNPNWPDRDRIIWSTGHKAPSLYLGLAFAGFCPIDDVVTLRKLNSPFQGHPHWLKLPGVEVSTGSLGQGLSISVGVALAARLDNKNHKIFCIMGDGEQQEGQVWEAAMEAGHYQLDNLIAIIDCNRLQIDGAVKDVMAVEPLAAKAIAKFWWLWLAIGIAWIIAALAILQFDQASINTISIILGVMFFAAGMQQFVISAIADHMKWLFILFGVFFVIAGIVCFAEPEDTFAGLADMLGFLFLIVGVFWTIQAFVEKDVNPVWWLSLLSGILMILMAFWTSGQLFIEKVYTLLVFAGVWGMMHGLSDIFRAFRVRSIRNQL